MGKHRAPAMEKHVSACKKWFFCNLFLTEISEDTIMRRLFMSEPAVIDNLEFARTAQRNVRDRRSD
jgi:hypothetical protein